MRNWIETALAAAQDLPGADRGCVVILTETHEANVRWANNALTTNGQMHRISAEVVALAGVEGGIASGCLQGPVTDAEQVVDLVRRAAAIAAAGAPDADAHDLPGGSVDSDFDEPAATTSFDVFADLAADLGAAFEQAGDQHLLFGFAEHTVTTTWLGSSTGARRRAVGRTGRLELNAKHPDMVGSAWVGQSTADFTDVDMSAKVAEALERLSWSANRVDLPAGRYEVILPPSAVADLMIYAYWSMAGRDAREGQSVFAGPDASTRVGERLAPIGLDMWSDPAAPGLERPQFVATGASQAGLFSVYDNGADVGRVDWLTGGRLATLVETSHEQQANGLTGPLPHPTDNLFIDGHGTADLQEMVASTQRGLLLTCLWYVREVDPETLLLTGLTRDGVYLVENGKIVGAVNNFRWNESPVGLLGRISEVGRAERTLCREWNDWFNLTVAPALRVPDFNMSTVSQAS
ncbi:metallopeptidase TldD-related protein [Aestuariimicrobium sp. Y1814]|uniref:metallopeptidase TldD-related protein n=1 Tax=Aestuariimicrobium sp. Y1814 TaxID=3418742 RepID=UPI003DA764C1